jgi:leader peptidase (prepilin peptidase)/N-methyltransferase
MAADMIPTPLISILVFIFGAIIGSFLNVCIHRIPLKISVSHPPSRCPQCETPIAFYDNLPILSWLLLRGRCRKCGLKISGRYPLVELYTALLALCVYFRYGLTPATPIFFGFIAVLLVVTFIDIDHRIIPNRITLPGIPICFLATFLLPQISRLDSVQRILAGGGILLAVAKGYELLTGKEGMGGGDVKLLAMMGALIGWQGTLFTIFASSLAGSVTGIIMMVRKGKNMKMAVPFGPFLALGGIGYVLVGTELIHWYFSRLGY